MVLVAVGFISGIGSASDKINYSLDDYYKSQNVSDFIVKSEDDNGFTEAQVNAVKEIDGVGNVETGMSFDAYIQTGEEKLLTRLYFFDADKERKINVFETLDSIAEDGAEYAAGAEQGDNKIKGIPLGTQIELDFKDILVQVAEQGGRELNSTMLNMLGRLKTKTVTVTKTVKSPLTFANDGEPSYLNTDLTEIPDDISAVNNLDYILENILYLPTDIIPSQKEIMSFLPDEKLIKSGDMYVTFENRNIFNAFDKKYKTYVEEMQGKISSALGVAEETDGEAEAGGTKIEFISLYKNYSFKSLKAYSDKVMGIGAVLMVAFVFVTALVVLSTMTRLLEEERSQIACLKTLGYSSAKVIFNYLLFALIATALGGVGSYFLGLGLAHLLYFVFNYSFAMPPVSSHIALVFFIITLSIIVVTTLAATLIAGHRLTREAPANLLRPKPPKAGKKVFLEKIPFLWNRFSFKYKSTLRNVLRYKSRFFMTLVAVAVSTSLVMAGLALLDLCIFGGIESISVMMVAIVVVAFAGLLTVVVIYTLTNINVSERNRELATLQVLGYTDKEIAGYIYREVYIDTAVGILFGFPLSAFLIWLVFGVMGMGTVGGVTWFWWLIAPVVVFAFTAFVTLILRRKIVGIDMNESLKAIE